MNNQKGFTLIELVVVIVILGILAAVAVPKFVDMQGEAKKGVLEGIRGSWKSAVMMSHAKWLAAGDDTATSITVDGVSVNMSNGYPVATETALENLVDLDNLLDDGEIAVTENSSETPPNMVIVYGDYQFTYTEAADADTLPITTTVDETP